MACFLVRGLIVKNRPFNSATVLDDHILIENINKLHSVHVRMLLRTLF
jgi:hypothetical protein